jgi:Fe-S-cluster containining protein
MTGFSCKKCGNCCRAPGYVRLRAGEQERIAGHLGLGVGEFTARYTRLTIDRRNLSLTEKDDGSCVFLTDGNACAIHEVKPRQCREFPLGWSFPGYERTCMGTMERHEGR